MDMFRPDVLDQVGANSVRRLERGGIPVVAEQRLQALRASAGALFTSDLSVNDFLLVRDAGFDPVGLVLGSSIYHLGFQPPRGGGGELTTLSQAMYSARELATTRVEEEAAQLGADGVIGVRLQVGRHDWGPGLVEFFAIGTAVVPMPGAPGIPSPTTVLSLDT